MHLLPVRQHPPILPIAAMGVREKRTDITTCLRSLETEGRLLVDHAENSYFCDNETRRVMPVSSDNGAFLRYLGSVGVTPDKQFMEMVKGYACAHGRRAEIRRISWVNPAADTIYVHSQGKKVFKVTVSGIEPIANGDDDVFFLAEPDSRPFDLVEDDKVSDTDPFYNYLVKPFCFANGALSADQGKFMVMSWFMCMLVAGLVPVVPALVLVGPASTGKTTMLKLFSQLLFDGQVPVQRAPEDRRTLDGILGRRSFLCFDNLTNWSPWLDERIESIVRRETVHVKRGSQMVELHLASFLAITTRQFPDAGLQSINRLLPILLERPRHVLLEREMVAAVRNNRNAIMTNLLKKLQRLLISMANPGTGYQGVFSAADFADLVFRMAKCVGFDQQATDALDRIAALHDTVLPADNTTQLLQMWVAVEGNAGRQVKASQLHREVEELARDNNITFSMACRPFAYWLAGRIEQLRRFLSVEQIQARSRQMYYVLRQRIDAAGTASRGDT